MNDVNRQIRDRIEAFVSELNELVRQAALDAVSDALRSGGAATLRRGAVSDRSPRAGLRRGGGKRTPDEIDATAAHVLAYVERSPGQGVEQMARDLDISTRELTLPIKKLLADGRISTKGHKRATKYFAGSASAAPSGRKRKAAAKPAAKPARTTKRRRRARKSKRG